MPQFVIAALYQFVSLPDYRELRDPLKAFCVAQGIKGTLLLAEEGINGTVAGSRAAIDALKSWLAEDGRFDNLEYKESFDDDQPFYRMKVNLKKEIVTLGVQGIDPNKKVGTYVDPQDWNELISDPDVILIDTRNDYEYRIGTFRNAVDPETATFREFPKYVADNLDPKRHRKVAMFCTGGIRCEKATAFMLEQGFDEVYHLKGGILNYLEKIPEAGSLWDGECFVFDNRVSIKHGLEVGEHVLCHACRMPLSEEDRASEDFKEGVSCPHCIEELTERKRQRFSERQRQVELAEARNQVHVGQVLPS